MNISWCQSFYNWSKLFCTYGLLSKTALFRATKSFKGNLWAIRQMNLINQIYESHQSNTYESNQLNIWIQFTSNIWIQIKSMNPNQIKSMNPIHIKYMNSNQIYVSNPNQIYESNPNQIYESKSNLWIQFKSNIWIQIKWIHHWIVLLFYTSHLLLFISFHYYLFSFMMHQNVAFHIITNTYECILYCFVVVCVYLVPSVLLCVCLLQLGIHICMRKSNPTKTQDG